MRISMAILLSTTLVLLPLAGCDVRPSADAWHLTAEGVLLHKAGERDPVLIALPGWIWAGEPYGCGPALAVGPAGEAVITSDVVPIVWRVDPRDLRVSMHTLELSADKGRDIGFSKLTYSSVQGAFIAVSRMHGSLWKIDAKLTKAERITPDSVRAQAAKAAAAMPCGAPGRLL